MPLRSLPFPLVTRLLRSFHTSAPFRDGSTKPNHYETLQIPTNASPSEVKKSFYNLSKTHHPDRNPDDPSASERFVRISEAYTILGTPAKRQAYDHEHIHSHHSHHHSSRSHHRPQGSYSSSSPAGGRPASGLSRRRTQFRGPPPSFYRSGGWGEHSAKRKAAQENGAPGAERPPEHDRSGSGTAEGIGGGMGPGQTPFGDANDVPHFDREGHFRTHENHRQRWARKRRATEEGYIPAGEVPRGTLANFLFVGAIISLGIFIPSFIFEKLTLKKGSSEKTNKK